jgi:hypothetical protein
VLRESVDEAAAILRDLSKGEESFVERLKTIQPRTLSAIKKLAKVLNDAGAAAKIVSAKEEVRMDRQATSMLHGRLTEFEIVEDQETRKGMLYGLLPERQQYEFKPENDDPVFYGPVSEELDNRYLSDREFEASILLKPVIASFLVVTTVRAGQLQSQERVLEDVRPDGEPDSSPKPTRTD